MYILCNPDGSFNRIVKDEIVQELIDAGIVKKDPKEPGKIILIKHPLN